MNKFCITIAALLCIVFAACKKVSGPADGNSIQPNNNQDSTVMMSATINGNNWQTDSAFGYRVQSSGNDSAYSNLMITATQKSNGVSTITFNITNYTGPAAYPINPPVNTATYYIGTVRHYATSGSIVVTDTANYSLIADFNFVADSFDVQGKFNVAMP